MRALLERVDMETCLWGSQPWKIVCPEMIIISKPEDFGSSC